MVTMGGDLQPGSLADRLLTGLGIFLQWLQGKAFSQSVRLLIEKQKFVKKILLFNGYNGG